MRYNDVLPLPQLDIALPLNEVYKGWNFLNLKISPCLNN
jgi:hypothetical protein